MAALAKRRAIYADEVRAIVNRQFAYLSGMDNQGKQTKTHALDWLAASGFCECGCMAPLAGKAFEFEHTIPIALQYEGDPIEWKVWLKSCHAAKTKTDVKRIAKAKRQGGETGQQARRERNGPKMRPTGRKIQSRNTLCKSEREYKSRVKVID